jgi:hypothetical protein
VAAVAVVVDTDSPFIQVQTNTNRSCCAADPRFPTYAFLLVYFFSLIGVVVSTPELIGLRMQQEE